MLLPPKIKRLEQTQVRTTDKGDAIAGKTSKEGVLFCFFFAGIGEFHMG
jgi:hypothetical protein